jgi:hypothetical protein
MPCSFGWWVSISYGVGPATYGYITVACQNAALSAEWTGQDSPSAGVCRLQSRWPAPASLDDGLHLSETCISRGPTACNRTACLAIDHCNGRVRRRSSEIRLCGRPAVRRKITVAGRISSAFERVKEPGRRKMRRKTPGEAGQRVPTRAAPPAPGSVQQQSGTCECSGSAVGA